jgi:hypothetical protein
VRARLSPASAPTTSSIFLVEHQDGYFCGRLHFDKSDRITIQPTQLPFANVEFQLGTEARILGIVDLEFRVLTNPEAPGKPPCSFPEVAPDLARLWTPGPFRRTSQENRFTVLLRDARLRAGLSFRDASRLSKSVALVLGDERYFISQASLSDYEARNILPRHIHKLLTFSTLYAIPFERLIEPFGFSLEQQGAIPIPDECMTDKSQIAERELRQNREPHANATAFLTGLVAKYGPPPFFLRDSLASFFGIPELSLRDIFWVRGPAAVLHPALRGAVFVVINRKRRTPPAILKKSLWDEPLYLLERRDGLHLLASCTLEDRLIVVHPHNGDFLRSERLQNHADAEVIGLVVGAARTLAPSM